MPLFICIVLMFLNYDLYAEASQLQKLNDTHIEIPSLEWKLVKLSIIKLGGNGVLKRPQFKSITYDKQMDRINVRYSIDSTYCTNLKSVSNIKNNLMFSCHVEWLALSNITGGTDANKKHLYICYEPAGGGKALAEWTNGVLSITDSEMLKSYIKNDLE